MTAPTTVWPCDRCGGRMMVVRSGGRRNFMRPVRREGLVFRRRECRDCGLAIVTIEGGVDALESLGATIVDVGDQGVR